MARPILLLHSYKFRRVSTEYYNISDFFFYFGHLSFSLYWFCSTIAVSLSLSLLVCPHITVNTLTHSQLFECGAVRYSRNNLPIITVFKVMNLELTRHVFHTVGKSENFPTFNWISKIELFFNELFCVYSGKRPKINALVNSTTMKQNKKQKKKIITAKK